MKYLTKDQFFINVFRNQFFPQRRMFEFRHVLKKKLKQRMWQSHVKNPKNSLFFNSCHMTIVVPIEDAHALLFFSTKIDSSLPRVVCHKRILFLYSLQTKLAHSHFSKCMHYLFMLPSFYLKCKPISLVFLKHCDMFKQFCRTMQIATS